MENTTEAPILSPKGTFPAKVAKVIDQYKLVINKGKIHGIRESQRMLVYYIDNEEIKDPDTGKSLGFLELVRGSGRIILVEEEYSILESDQIVNRPLSPSYQAYMSTQIEMQKYLERTLKSFDNPQVGDLVKPI